MNDTSTSLPHSFLRRAAAVIALAVGLAAVVYLAWLGINALLLVFAGLLLGVLLNGVSRAIGDRTSISYRWALSWVLVLAVLIIAGFLLYAIPTVTQQVAQLRTQLSSAVDTLLQQFKQNPLGQQLIQRVEARDVAAAVFGGGQGAGYVAQTASWIVRAIVGLVIFLFVGIYFAYEPGLYRRGVMMLVPPARRPRIGQVLTHLDQALWQFLMGRLISMAIVGVLTAIGLWLLGVPLAIPLAVLAAILEFVPYLGPVLAAIPPILLALQQSPQLALWVLVFFVGIQFAESYLITPLVQRFEARLPPVVTIGSIVFMGMITGPLGVILAAPLALAVIVLVKDLYVEDVLDDETHGEKTTDRHVAATS